MDLSKKITILIPTYNRYAYLKRLLRYYLHSEIVFSILIADSSAVPLDDELTRLIGSPRLNYLKFPSEITPQEKISQALRKIATEYVLLCADDDFIVPSAIGECADFMEKNPDYSVALGVYCSHSLRKRKKGKIEFDWAPGEYGKSITLDSPAERLKFHLTNYDTATFYGVHRTNTLRFIFEEALVATSHGRLGEILLTGLTLIYGKMEVLPIFYASREHGSSSVENTLSVIPYFHAPWSLFLAGDKYDAECSRAIVCLAKNIQKQTDLNIDMSTKIAEDALNGYFDPLRPRTDQRIRNVLKKILFGLHLRGLILAIYKRMNNIRSSIGSNERLKRVRTAKIEYSNLLGESDSRFYENINQIREAVIESEVHVTR